MELVPQHRALFGVDVVGSARNPGHLLNAVRTTVDEALDQALWGAGISPSEVLEQESTGDGALLTLPSGRLGALFDMAQHLEIALAEHNKWRRPDVRMRIAVEVGPVGDRPGLYPAKITLARLLNSEAFKRTFRRCVDDRRHEGASTALIASDHALRTAFGGDHTTLVRRAEFTRISVRDKEFTDTAWIRVPGSDLRDEIEPTTSDQPASGGVSNHVTGTMHGVQAHTVNGGITFGVPRDSW
ncbi:hypothetical protein [Umezawaea sp. Da 62-37]|uniref:hypothetical protein n=1 Tax=Umezawaea sp. Da 62-37 TaxID=3075927 RepID=UPI0028F7189F|nr:hypothetical protein [Umezawaea sp. Da 62-37]WNV83403.1 hypothetical protein RM788_35215 [Umezawaea sp. Da 62-37]